MADLFGDDLSGVFDEESPASSKAEEPGTSSSSAGRGKRNLKAPATTAGPVSLKREAGCLDVPEECMLRKKLKIESSAVDEINLADIMPRVKLQEVDTFEECTHEVALPADDEYIPLRPRDGRAAMEYPFRLQGFQKEAILCIDNEQSVFVSAHSSAEKNVCAEYIIALALRKVIFQDSHERQLLLPPGQETRHFKIFKRYAIAVALKKHQRVVFTCPMKSLSEKYSEIYGVFHDVGLMTEDITIKPKASCLVMTSKNLRKMLYRGSDVMREVAWVIFDDIQCMGDSESGAVWEETIILLSPNVRCVFLSAVIPNAHQFAQWICHLHNRPCHVIYADYSLTLLQLCMFTGGGDGLNLVDKKGSADPLNSAFHLAFSMVLNYLLVDDFIPERILQKSFKHYQAVAGAAEKVKMLEELQIPKPKYEQPGSLVKFEEDLRAAKQELKNACPIFLKDELESRKRVLRRMGFTDSSGVLTMKGRVACGISSADELLLTELLFDGLFKDLTVEHATAILSCFVFQENSSEMPKLTEQLAGPLRQMQETALRIAQLSAEMNLGVIEKKFLKSFSPNLMGVVYCWANGATLSQLCKMTNVLEDCIIRCMRRLAVLLQQMRQAARVIGNPDLEKKFAEGFTKINRDVVRDKLHFRCM